eukprot:3941935-Rhodomonas_salina.5
MTDEGHGTRQIQGDTPISSTSTDSVPYNFTGCPAVTHTISQAVPQCTESSITSPVLAVLGYRHGVTIVEIQ